MLMSLGLFIFSVPTVTYNQLQRRTAFRHSGQSRVGTREALQYVGPGDDIITLSGVLPHGLAGDSNALKDLRAMGERGAAWPLLSGAGQVFGAFVIQDLDETQKSFFQDGVARMSDFTLSLKRVDDDEVQPDGGGDQLNALDLGGLVGLF